MIHVYHERADVHGRREKRKTIFKTQIPKDEPGSELYGVTPELTIATEKQPKFSRDARAKFLQTGAGFWSIYVIHVYHNGPISMRDRAKSAKGHLQNSDPQKPRRAQNCMALRQS